MGLIRLSMALTFIWFVCRRGEVAISVSRVRHRGGAALEHGCGRAETLEIAHRHLRGESDWGNAYFTHLCILTMRVCSFPFKYRFCRFIAEMSHLSALAGEILPTHISKLTRAYRKC